MIASRFLVILLPLAFLSSGCESVALVGRPTLPPGVGSEERELVGRIEGLDFNREVIFIEPLDGHRQSIIYKPHTRVLIAGREYGVSSLRVGDRVAMQLLSDERGTNYTELVRVRSGPEIAREFLEGRVEGIHVNRGYLEIRSRAGELTRAYLRYNPKPYTEESFHRVRAGDYVRVMGEFVSEHRFEIEDFVERHGKR